MGNQATVVLLALLLVLFAYCHEYDHRLIEVVVEKADTAYAAHFDTLGCSLQAISRPNKYYYYCESYPVAFEEHGAVSSVSVVPAHISTDVAADAPHPRLLRDITPPDLRETFTAAADLDMHVEHIVVAFHTPQTSDAQARAVSEADALLETVAMPLFIHFHTPSTLVIGLPLATSPASVASLLAGLPGVAHIGRHTEMQVDNVYASVNLQGDAAKDELSIDREGARPFFDLGLVGQDMIVGIGDSGVDVKHCFFHDENVPVTFDEKMETHRKILYYNSKTSTTSNKEDNNGHGTHVAGSVLGCPSTTGAGYGYRGMAPKARLYFSDLGNSTTSSMSIPDDLYNDYFKPAADMGATVHSSSWSYPASVLTGMSDKTYDRMMLGVDRTAYLIPTLAIVLSAGNDGASTGPWSVASPSAAKNAITVGSSSSGYQSFEEVFCDNATTVTPHGFTSGDMADYCTIAKAKTLTSWRANSIAYYSSLGPTLDGRTKPDLAAPGNYIVSARNVNDAVGAPTCDLSTDFIAMTGTSMSTPTLAGAVALAQEFFKKGMHVDGSEDPAAGFVATSSLMRAALIATAQEMDGVYRRSTVTGSTTPTHYPDVPPTPNNVNGWGRVGLGNLRKHTLLIKEESQSVDITTALPVQKFTVTVTDATVPLVVAMAWRDPPAAAGSQFTLVNGLGLWVETPAGVWYTGNHDGPAMGEDLDANNVNHRVTIPATALTTGVHNVYVHGHMLMSPQPYSLVAWGALDRAAWTPTPTSLATMPGCIGGCNAGMCVNNACVCDSGHNGVTCTLSITPIPADGLKVTMLPLESMSFSVDAAVTTKVQFKLVKKAILTDAITGKYITGALVDAVYGPVPATPTTLRLANYNDNGFTIDFGSSGTKQYIMIGSRDPWNNIEVYINRDVPGSSGAGRAAVAVAAVVLAILALM